MGLEQAQISFCLSLWCMALSVMIHNRYPCYVISIHSSSYHFSTYFPPSILEKMVNGAGSHKRRSTGTQSTDISPACTSLSDSAEEEETIQFPAFICLRLEHPAFHRGMPDCPGLLQPLQVGRVQMPSHLLQLSPRDLTQRMAQFFTSEPPWVYWCHPLQNRTKWKEARNCRNADPLCRTCKC